MSGYRIAVDPREIVYCNYCSEPLLYIYDHKLRQHCHPCLLEISLENAKSIVGDSRK